MSLSVIMIVKDEEKNLPRCLNSVSQIADEIVVVDTGSTDGSVNIALNYGAIVKKHIWRDSFSLARNESLKLATMPWVMWMDADDELTPESIENIRYLKDQKPDVAYSFVIENISAEGGHSLGITRFSQLRMFPNRSDIRFKGAGEKIDGEFVPLEGRLHEQVSYDIRHKLRMRVYQCNDVVVNHHGYKDENANVEKLFRNNRLRLIEMGYPEGTNFYTFQTKAGYLCFYAPNTLTVWRRMVIIGAVNPFENGMPEDVADRITLLTGKAEQIADEFDANGLGPKLDAMKIKENERIQKTMFCNSSSVTQIDDFMSQLDKLLGNLTDGSISFSGVGGASALPAGF